MKKQQLLIVLLLAGFTAFTQPRIITVSTEHNADRTGSNGTESLLLNRLYTATQDIIAKELSKKEKKKLGIQ
jgi:hypothetical protein